MSTAKMPPRFSFVTLRQVLEHHFAPLALNEFMNISDEFLLKQ